MTTTPESDELGIQIQSPRDSAIASPGWASSTCSVRSEDLGYWSFYGRLYGRGTDSRLLKSFKVTQIQAGFPTPIDDRAKEDHDFRHAVFEKVLKGRKFCAPVNLEGADVLEIYTRTGILAMDIADTDPSCLVIGVDESGMPAEYVPPNLRFEICNPEDGDDRTWRQRFRLIIIRQHGVFVKDLSALIRRCYEHLEDKGRIEFQILTLQHQSYSRSQRPVDEGSAIRTYIIIYRMDLPGSGDSSTYKTTFLEYSRRVASAISNTWKGLYPLDPGQRIRNWYF
ncbi:hypothetical protein LTR41_011220 [Exophiala xenobiotica]|nr:hypothetical protein LTR41_011220 [Exophiala xenobiotica]KAK5550950.1 hypothetical protein LTR46_011059 [Exophiala xenobiotica]